MAPVRRTVGSDGNGMRIDRYLAEVLSLLPRSQVRQRAVRLTVNGKPAKLSHRLRTGEELSFELAPPPPSTVNPEPVALSILFEDDNVIVIDKPAGMVVHPGHGNYHGTLVQGLLHHVAGLGDRFAGTPSEFRPGIVHRLDKDTSGVIIAAKNPATLEFLAAQFRTRRAGKLYLAVLKCTPSPPSGEVGGFIRRDPRNRKRFAYSEQTGKRARTIYRVTRTLGSRCLAELRPKTGRTHQLRVHMHYLGCPIVGDPLYGRGAGPDDTGLMLHARRLRIRIPDGTPRGARREFIARLPERFIGVLRDADRP